MTTPLIHTHASQARATAQRDINTALTKNDQTPEQRAVDVYRDNGRNIPKTARELQVRKHEAAELIRNGLHAENREKQREMRDHHKDEIQRNKKRIQHIQDTATDRDEAELKCQPLYHLIDVYQRKYSDTHTSRLRTIDETSPTEHNLIKCWHPETAPCWCKTIDATLSGITAVAAGFAALVIGITTIFYLIYALILCLDFTIGWIIH